MKKPPLKKSAKKTVPAKAKVMVVSPARSASLRRKNCRLGIFLGLFALTLAASVFVWQFTHPVAQVTITQPGE